MQATTFARGRACATMGAVEERALTLERIVRAPRALVWGLITDTDRADRALGLAPPRYVWRELEGRRQLVGAAKQNGMLLEWIEDPSDWVEAVYLRSQRRYLKGPLAAGGLRFELDDVAEGTRIRVTAWTLPRAWYFPLVEPLVRGSFRRRLRGYLDDVQAILEGNELDDPPGTPPAVSVRRAVQRASTIPQAHVISPTNTVELERRRKRLELEGIEPEAVRRLVDMLAARPDDEITQMRPFELARTWRLDRKAVVTCFLGSATGLKPPFEPPSRASVKSRRSSA